MNYIGLDGCRLGWASFSENHDCILLFKKIEDVFEYYGKDSIYFIDIPIGLSSQEKAERNCENEMRRHLPAKFKSSLFTVPCREAVYASSYPEANEINRKILEKGISKQSWNICPKIKEVDFFLRNNNSVHNIFFESHPEIAFYYLNMQNLKFGKKTEEGFKERISILEKYLPSIEKITAASLEKYKRKDVQRDDILDAVCMQITAKLYFEKKVVPSDFNSDAEGLRMKIHYVDLAAAF